MTEYIALPYRAKNITGQRFGRLVALGPVGVNKWGKVNWECQCDCGDVTISASNSLWQRRSCGCSRKTPLSDRRPYDTSKVNRTHGMSYERIYRIWGGIKNRCTKTNDPSYERYAGRGIAVCDEWRESFEAFYCHVSALPNYGQKEYTLDRIDNNGNYEPGNVRWATAIEQQRNTRDNHLLVFRGRTQCLSAWAEELGMQYDTLFSRIQRGWNTEKALTTPVKAYKGKPTRSLYMPVVANGAQP